MATVIVLKRGRLHADLCRIDGTVLYLKLAPVYPYDYWKMDDIEISLSILEL